MTCLHSCGLVSIALVLAAAPLFAQPPLEGKPIVAVRVSGLVHVKETVVVAQIESVPGRPYHQVTADQDIARLDRLGVFGEISVTAVTVDDGVRVDVTVTETPRIVPAVAIAVTDENGVSAGPAVKLTSIAGHPLDVVFTTRFGGESLVEFREVSPQLTNRWLWHSMKLSTSNHFNKLDQFEQNSVELDARLGFRSSERWRSGAIFQIFNVGSDQSGITLSSDNHDSFQSFGGITEFDSRDSWREPFRGWLSSVDALWTTGSGEYATLNVDVRRYQPVATRQTVVATALLTVQSGVDGVDVPTYANYSLGGENTVRGQPFGAKRGKDQFISTIEYRYGILPTRGFHVAGLDFYGGLALAAFADVGSAWSDSDGFSDGFIGGGGIGLRVYIPYINMIRLDLSVGSGVHAGLGINEKAVAQRNRVR
jgi:outer membrane protein assembly factor BamA